jgi:hypothetical protein
VKGDKKDESGYFGIGEGSRERNGRESGGDVM